MKLILIKLKLGMQIGFAAENLPLIPGKISIARKIIDWFVANY